MGFKPTEEQKTIFKYIRDRNENILIHALADAGKSSTIVSSLKYLPEDKKIIFVAFNKHIRDELREKLPEHVHCNTLHSLGFGAIKRAYGDSINFEEYKLDKTIKSKSKSWNLEREYPDYNERMDYLKGIKELVNLTRATVTMKKKYVPYLANNWDIKYNTEQDASRVFKILEAMVSDKKSFDYNDMVYMAATDPKIWLHQYDYVFVDEIQDLTRAQQYLLNKLIKKDRISKKQTGRFCFVGDVHQCQPAGTKILMYDGSEKNIEDIEVGDRVVSYEKKSACRFHGYYKNHRWGAESVKNRAPVIEEVSKYKLDNNILINISSGGKNTKYTLNHRCFVRFREDKTNAHVLYLMERNGYFRVGIGPLWSLDERDSVTKRAKGERADKFWVLQIYEKKHDAYVEEQYYSLQYGIPQLRFFDNNTGHFTQEKMDDFYARFDRDVMRESAINLLNHFSKRIQYPLWEKGAKNYFSKIHLFEIKACNIIPDYMQMIHFDENNIKLRTHGVNGKKPDRFYKPTYINIDKLTYETYDDYVYSLKVSKLEAYVADGIVTHNSIYSFTGVDKNTYDWFAKIPNIKPLPLTTTFRCSKAVVREAQKIVPTIKWAEGAEEGEVRSGSVVDEATDGDFVLCRKESPLVELFFEFLLKGKKAVVKGTEMGKNVVDMAKDYSDLNSASSHWLSSLRELRQQLMSSGVLDYETNTTYLALQQKVDTFVFMAKLSNSIEDLKKKCDKMFDDKVSDGITLMTVHKSKGLEADRVFIIRPDILPMNTKMEWQRVQETNLKYIAITRAKKELVWDYDWLDEAEKQKRKNK